MELLRHMENLKSPWRSFSNFICREQVLSLRLTVPVGVAKDAFRAADYKANYTASSPRNCALSAFGVSPTLSASTKVSRK